MSFTVISLLYPVILIDKLVNLDRSKMKKCVRYFGYSTVKILGGSWSTRKVKVNKRLWLAREECKQINLSSASRMLRQYSKRRPAQWMY